MRTLAALTTDELRDTALAVVGQHGHLESAQIPQMVALALDSDIYSPAALQVPEGHYREISTAQARFASRVRFALDKLADASKIVKVGANQMMPNGYSSGNTAHYYTVPEYEATVQKHNDKLKARIALHNRWQGIRVRLLDGADVNLSAQYQLSPDEWEQLLDKAGW